jgi:hypothetical protein
MSVKYWQQRCCLEPYANYVYLWTATSVALDNEWSRSPTTTYAILIYPQTPPSITMKVMMSPFVSIPLLAISRMRMRQGTSKSSSDNMGIVSRETRVGKLRDTVVRRFSSNIDLVNFGGRPRSLGSLGSLALRSMDGILMIEEVGRRF